VIACAAWDIVVILAHRCSPLVESCRERLGVDLRQPEMTVFPETVSPSPHWYFIPVRVLLVTIVVSLLSFAASLFLGICAIVLAAKLRHIPPDLRIAYRFIAAPAAGIVAAIVLVSATFMEVRHYRRLKVLHRMEHQIGRPA
jgi:hypothetical protein